MAAWTIDAQGIDHQLIIDRATTIWGAHRITAYYGDLEAGNRRSQELAERVIAEILAEQQREAEGVGTATWAKRSDGSWLAKGDFAVGQVVDVIRRDGSATRVRITEIVGVARDGQTVALYSYDI